MVAILKQGVNLAKSGISPAVLLWLCTLAIFGLLLCSWLLTTGAECSQHFGLAVCLCRSRLGHILSLLLNYARVSWTAAAQFHASKEVGRPDNMLCLFSVH